MINSKYLIFVRDFLQVTISILSFMITRIKKNNPAKRYKVEREKYKVITRDDVIGMIVENGGAKSLDLSGKDLSDVDLSGLNLGGVNFSKSKLSRTSFRGAFLERSNFQEANCRGADLSYSMCWSANFNSASLAGINFYKAYLHLCDFQNAILDGGDLREAELRQAILSGTRFSRESIGERILEENLNIYHDYLVDFEKRAAIFRGPSVNPDELENRLNSRFHTAEEIYKNLKNNFFQLGSYNDASWAYIKERQMRKLMAKEIARGHFKAKDYIQGLNWMSKYIIDLSLEMLCDFGESISKVIRAMILLILIIGPLLLSSLGGLDDPQLKLNELSLFNRNEDIQFFTVYLAYVRYMIDVVATSEFSDIKPANDAVSLMSGILSLSGIFLAGLLGFVTGNKIRNS